MRHSAKGVDRRLDDWQSRALRAFVRSGILDCLPLQINLRKLIEMTIVSNDRAFQKYFRGEFVAFCQTIQK